MSYASVHNKQQMDAIYFGDVCAQFVASTIALSAFSYGIFQSIIVIHYSHMFVSIYAKLFAQKTVKYMECNDLLTQLLEDGGSANARLTTSRRTNASNRAETVVYAAAGTAINKQRARLAARVSGGEMTFKGHAVTPERIDAMENAEIEELHARYEAPLGVAMNKSLGSSLLHMYASMASMLIPLPPSRQLELVADLEQDPFVSSAIQSACCKLYYCYVMYLAPLTTALTTTKHCDWGRIKDDAFNHNTPPSAISDQTNDGRSEEIGASRAGEAIGTTNNCESERP